MSSTSLPRTQSKINSYIDLRFIKKRERNPYDKWHLDKMNIKINGEWFALWRAVDQEGLELDVFLQKRRNKK